MSRTDKTRPYFVKREEYEKADPYSMKREASIDWRSGLHGSNQPGCYACGGWTKEENRKERRRGRKLAKDWWKEER
jgi:hypothetical protein